MNATSIESGIASDDDQPAPEAAQQQQKNRDYQQPSLDEIAC